MSCVAFGTAASASQARQRRVVVGAQRVRVEVGRRAVGRRRARRRSARRCRGPTGPGRRRRPGSPSRACSSSHCVDLVGVEPLVADVEALLGLGRRRPRVANSRSRSTRNCRSSKSVCTSSRSHCCARELVDRRVELDVADQFGQLPVAQHAGQVLAQRVADLALDGVDLLDERRRSEPYSRTHLAAVFSPTPGMLGRLSLGSPRSAAKSGYCAGVRPYFSSTSAG